MFTASPVLSTAGVGVLGTGACLPGRVLTNDEVGAPADVDHAWILRKTGIQERRWAKPDEATSDLAGQAGREALAQAGIAAADLAVVIVATSTPDHPQPPTANLVQYRLGALRAAAFDVNAVCSGFVFALAVGNQMVAANRGYALVIGADVYSRILNPADRKTAVLFGDGAGAVVLGPVTGRRGILATALHSFGEQWELIRVPGGGSRYPASADVLAAGSQYFRSMRDHPRPPPARGPSPWTRRPWRCCAATPAANKPNKPRRRPPSGYGASRGTCSPARTVARCTPIT
jgi:3-oxoacyl-(acyl-carrier-protein) synthase III